MGWKGTKAQRKRSILKKQYRRRKYLADEARRKENNANKNSIRASAIIQKQAGNIAGKTEDELYKIWEDINKGG